MDDTIAPVLPHPHMPLHDAFANPQADAYKRSVKSKLDFLKKHEEYTKSAEIRALKRELECIDAMDTFFKKALIFEKYEDLDKFLTHDEAERYKKILCILRDARISEKASFLEKFYTPHIKEE